MGWDAFYYTRRVGTWKPTDWNAHDRAVAAHMKRLNEGSKKNAKTNESSVPVKKEPT